MLNNTALQTFFEPSVRRSTPGRCVALSAALLVAGTAAACAPSSRIDVAHTGLTPAPAPQTYVLAHTTDPTPDDGKAAQAVKRHLETMGWIAPSATPDWKVETAYVVRANSVGAVGGAVGSPVESEDGSWLIQPERRRWWQRRSKIHALSVRLVRPATGEELGRATAHMHLIGPMNDSLMDSLASAAVSRMVQGVAAPTS